MKYSEATFLSRPGIQGHPLAGLVVCVWRRLLLLITLQRVLVISQSWDESVKHSH